MTYQLQPPETLNSIMTVTLNLYGAARRFQLHFRWHACLQKWRLDIYETTGECLVSDIPLVSGTDLLKPFRYKRLGRVFVLPVSDIPPSPDPLEDGLQSDFVMVWGDE